MGRWVAAGVVAAAAAGCSVVGLDEAVRRWHWHARATPEQRTKAAAPLQAYERELRALMDNGASNGAPVTRTNGQ
ncbi:hypothetical protein Tther_01355 [Tepidimonas thermarum]|uniref:Lipoprotein n=1 Tax=Tepidimonas thermarum TaxID=335431 RepID=A0A554X1L0_9BURK|nr:hypothetical protein [Tepidimonas thermarum]TSE29729.1 hypothetical protein Tther_01355 [Tepidimonas thermarum]